MPKLLPTTESPDETMETPEIKVATPLSRQRKSYKPLRAKTFNFKKRGLSGAANVKVPALKGI